MSVGMHGNVMRNLISGRVWKFGDNINTDLILPGHVMFLADDERKKFLFQALRPAWAGEVRASDIIIAGRSFGMGSSRPAAHALRNAGVACVIAESLGRLFFRNAVNFGLLALECPGILAAFEEGERATVNADDFSVRNETRAQTLRAKPVPASLLKLMLGGGIFPVLVREGLIASADPLPSRAK
jgi:3-isopropylmalate/(R)-2-methylmalate dehydratase small subunit